MADGSTDPVIAALSEGLAPADSGNSGTQGPDPDPVIAALQAPQQATSGPSTAQAMPGQQKAPGTLTSPVTDFLEGYSRNVIGNTVGAAAGGLRGLWDLAMGRGAEQASQDIEGTQGAVQGWTQSYGHNPSDWTLSGTTAPASAAERAGYAAASSNWNPLNWPGVALSWIGNKGANEAVRLGAGPGLAAAIDVAPTAAALLAGPARGVIGRDWTPYRVAAEETAGDTQSISAAAVNGGATPQGAPEPLGPPVEGGLPTEAQDARAATLARVGITNARESALQGDAKSAAVDYQMTKYDQPAGRAAAAQFQNERDALAAHTENLIGNTGGTVGMEEDALANRGATIARPFDMLRQWFSDRTRQLYAQADQRASGLAGGAYDTATGTTALTNLDSVDQMLADPSFRNTLMAKNQQGLLTAVQNQLENFRTNNPNGFSAAGAEQVRQWLNQVWTPDNKWAVGQLKGAIDEDVTSAAGEDIYAQARAIRQLQAQTLDNPRGVAQLFDADPNTPINRTTPLEKIPDKLTQLPIDQYANVIKTLQGMPDELQPDAQAALGEIRAQLLNKALQAGTQTSRGVGAQIWGTDRVSNVLRMNAAKFRIAFANDPVTQQGIEDLNNAGQILKVDQGYPGADAQAANAMKRGLISRALGHLGGAAGAATGSALGGPLGAAAGGALGESAGLSVAQRGAERSALKAWGRRVRTLATGGTSPQ